MRLHAELRDEGVRETLLAGEHRSALRAAGAHENDGAKLLSVLRGVGARQKRSHAVSHEEIRQLRIFRAHHFVKLVHIPHEVPRASLAEVAEGASLRDGFAVPEMIVDCHGESRLRQKAGKIHVQLPVLGHAVRNLQDAAHRPAIRGLYHADKNPFFAGAGIKRDFFLQQIHSAIPPSSFRTAGQNALRPLEDSLIIRLSRAASLT